MLRKQRIFNLFPTRHIRGWVNPRVTQGRICVNRPTHPGQEQQDRVWISTLYERCPVRLSNFQAVSLIQHVLMTLVLRLTMNGGFSFDSANRVFRVFPGFMGKSLVIAVGSST